MISIEDAVDAIKASMWRLAAFLAGVIVGLGVVASFVDCNRKAIRATQTTVTQQQSIIDEMAQQIVELHDRIYDQDYVGQIETIITDLNVCHARVDDVFWALEVVARVEGPRARAPSTPRRVRPTYDVDEKAEP